MKTPFTGGCYCGAVRYECVAREDQIQMFRCHCRDCQHITGGPFVPVGFMPKDTFRLTQGEIKHHDTRSDAMGRHTRGYCAACGSRLTGGEAPGSAIIGVTAGSLDDPSGFKPTVDIWMADAQPWDTSRSEPTQKFDQYAPM